MELLALLAEVDRRDRQRQFEHWFPDEYHEWRGECFWPRSGYSKHLEHFEAGALYRERCFMAANRVGKTQCGTYEVTAHLTGLYPDWWRGKRFPGRINAWVAGKTNETTRDILQAKLCGPVVHGVDGSKRAVEGTGMLPGGLIGEISWKQGVTDLIDTMLVKHERTGEWSKLAFKSYQQGRGSFEGTEQHVVLLDEEPPRDVYGECTIRTATTNGIVILTFTPLEGMSEVVLQFMPEDQRPEAA